LLTPRERVALAQIVRGASSKEAGRMLDKRLTSAAIHLVQLNERDIPDEFRDRFNALRSSLFSTTPSNDNQHMPRPAQDAAHEILDLFTSIMGGLQRAPRARMSP
jgi:hypothetical protein